MFAYCRNNPVRRVDISGTADADCLDEDGRPLSNEDIENLSRGGGGSTATVNIGQYVRNILDYVKSHNGSPPKGYKGGKTFANDGRDGGEVLPPNDAPYREYDVHPYVRGARRGTERIVVGASGTAWYTNDHYISFTRME